MSETYDFEFPMTPPAACDLCGALVQKREIHDEWHRQVVTAEKFLAATDAVKGRSSYNA